MPTRRSTMQLRTRRSDDHDAGVTLIELMIAVVILAVITVPLGNVVIGFLKNTDATSDRLVLSHEAQVSTAYFAFDVSSVGLRDYSGGGVGNAIPFQPSIQLGAAYNASPKTCGSSAT